MKVEGSRPVPAGAPCHVLPAVLFIVVAAGCTSPPPPAEEPFRKDHPPDVARAVSELKVFDHRPYEFIWAPREDPHDPLVDFSFVLGWTVEAEENLTAALARTQDEQLWGAHTAKVSAAGDPASGSIRLRPPDPIPIRNRFDCVDLWFYGDVAIADAMGAATVTARIEDADNQVHDLPLGVDVQAGWQLLHTRLSPAAMARISQPARFVGLRIDSDTRAPSVTYYLDSLSFYTEELDPLEFEALPSRNLELFTGQSPGIHSGPDRLGFPTREDTVMPEVMGPGIRNRIEEVEDGVFALSYHGPQGDLTWRMTATNLTQGLLATWDEIEIGRFFVQAGMKGSDLEASGVAVMRIEDGAVHVEYRNGSSYTISMVGTSLDISARSRSGAVEQVDMGRYQGPMDWSDLVVPGLPSGPSTCAVIGRLDPPNTDSTNTLFTSLIVDWYRSNGSAIERSTDTGGCRVRYDPRTDGTRNDVYERILFTLSRKFDDVLPVVPNPGGRHHARLRHRVWVDPDEFTDYDTARARSQHLASIGITNAMQGHLFYTWRDQFESCGLRSSAAPGKGGDDALKAFLSYQRGLGWEIGLSTDYLNLHPLNAYWSEDRLQRTTGWDWRRGLGSHYRLKTPLSIDLAGEIAPALQAKFAPLFTYVGAMTAVPPWDYTDYDARVPGAGTFSQPFYAIGGLLESASRFHHAPVIGDGGYEVFYAGLMDAYLVAAGASRAAGMPYLPLFVHQALNPLSVGIGSGDFWSFHRVQPGEIDITDRMVDAYLADQIAYGSVGRLVPDAAGPIRQARSYYMMQKLQSRYAGRRPERVAYWQGNHLVNTSEAIRSGAVARSQLYLMYGDDLEVWINGSEQETWNVRVGADQWELPPFGWVASGPDFLCVSARVGGGRIDYVEEAGERYIDGRGSPAAFRQLACATPVVVRSREEDGTRTVDVLDIVGADRIGLGGLDETGNAAVAVRALDDDAGGTVVEKSNGMVWISGHASAHRLVIAPVDADAPSVAEP